MDFAWKQFGPFALGWARVQAVCDFVHSHLRFDYQQARFDRTALDAFSERVGVCRDVTHLASRIGRIVIGRGRDAADVLIITTFGVLINSKLSQTGSASRNNSTSRSAAVVKK
jgi:hypothetical protein